MWWVGERELPVCIEFHELCIECGFLGRVLIAGFETTDVWDGCCVEGDVVFGLRVLVNILDLDVDCLTSVGFVEVDVADEVGIGENLRRDEGAGEDVGGLFGGAGVLGREDGGGEGEKRSNLCEEAHSG